MRVQIFVNTMGVFICLVMLYYIIIIILYTLYLYIPELIVAHLKATI